MLRTKTVRNIRRKVSRPIRLPRFQCEMFAGGDGGVFGGMGGVYATWQWRDEGVVVWVVKKDHGLATTAEGKVALRVGDAVNRRDPTVVGPAHHYIPYI